MAIKWGEALEKGLKFGVQPKRWLPFFALDLAFYSIMLCIVIFNFSMIGPVISMMAEGPAAMLSVAGLALVMFALFIIWNLLKLWVTGAVIHQAKHEKDFSKSFRVSFSRYLSLLGVAFITFIVSFVAGMVPYVSTILSVIVGLCLFFGLQGVMVGGKGFFDSLRDSFHMFRRRPVRVFIMWLLVSVIGGAIALVFTIPLLATLFMYILPYMGQVADDAMIISVLIAYLLNNLPLLICLGAVMIVGTSITAAFAIKAVTEFYMQSKGKMLGIIPKD